MFELHHINVHFFTLTYTTSNSEKEFVSLAGGVMGGTCSAMFMVAFKLSHSWNGTLSFFASPGSGPGVGG